MPFPTFITVTILHKGTPEGKPISAPAEDIPVLVKPHEFFHYSLCDAYANTPLMVYSVERDILVEEGDEKIKDGVLDETLVFVERILDLDENWGWVVDYMNDIGWEHTLTVDVMKEFFQIALKIHSDPETRKSADADLFETVNFIGLWTAEQSTDWETGITEIDYFDFLGAGKVVLDE